MNMNLDDIVETVVVEAPKKFYPLGALIGSAVGGAAVTAAGFLAVGIVKKRRVNKILENTSN